MSDATPRFHLPFILPGQAQKELFHNEALARIDGALHPAVEGAPVAAPPDDAADGRCWLVAAGGTGAWAGRDGSLATRIEGGWRFILAEPGMCVWDKAANFYRRWTGTQWGAGEVTAAALLIAGQQVVGPRQPHVPSPSGGTVIDEEARTAIAALTAALMSHGLIE